MNFELYFEKFQVLNQAKISKFAFLDLINSAYCAKEHFVPIDILTLEYLEDKIQKLYIPEQSLRNIESVYSQITDITHGIYQKCEKLSKLFHFLNNCFLSTSKERGRLITSTSECLADYRAGSFDTGALINIGFVCSLCLAVYENFQPICKSCESPVSIKF